MPIFTVTSDDTLIINDRVFVDLADDDVTAITFPNDRVKMKTGKNKNTLYAKDEQGQNASLDLRLSKGSSDDQFMQSLLAAADGNFTAQSLLSGQFVKQLGDGAGDVVREVYTLKGGVILRTPDGKENVSGDTSQAVAVYKLMFATAQRSIQ